MRPLNVGPPYALADALAEALWDRLFERLAKRDRLFESDPEPLRLMESDRRYETETMPLKLRVRDIDFDWDRLANPLALIEIDFERECRRLPDTDSLLFDRLRRTLRETDFGSDRLRLMLCERLCDALRERLSDRYRLPDALLLKERMMLAAWLPDWERLRDWLKLWLLDCDLERNWLRLADFDRLAILDAEADWLTLRLLDTLPGRLSDCDFDWDADRNTEVSILVMETECQRLAERLRVPLLLRESNLDADLLRLPDCDAHADASADA